MISHSYPQDITIKNRSPRASPLRKVNAMSEPMSIGAAGVEHDIRPAEPAAEPAKKRGKTQHVLVEMG